MKPNSERVLVLFSFENWGDFLTVNDRVGFVATEHFDKAILMFLKGMNRFGCVYSAVSQLSNRLAPSC